MVNMQIQKTPARDMTGGGIRDARGHDLNIGLHEPRPRASEKANPLAGRGRDRASLIVGGLDFRIDLELAGARAQHRDESQEVPDELAAVIAHIDSAADHEIVGTEFVRRVVAVVDDPHVELLGVNQFGHAFLNRLIEANLILADEDIAAAHVIFRRRRSTRRPGRFAFGGPIALRALRGVRGQRGPAFRAGVTSGFRRRRARLQGGWRRWRRGGSLCRQWAIRNFRFQRFFHRLNRDRRAGRNLKYVLATGTLDAPSAEIVPD